jgi:hypothetical protein
VSVCLILASVTSHWVPALASFRQSEGEYSASVSPLCDNENPSEAFVTDSVPSSSPLKQPCDASDAVQNAVLIEASATRAVVAPVMMNTRVLLERVSCSEDEDVANPAAMSTPVTSSHSTISVVISSINASGFTSPLILAKELLLTLRSSATVILSQGRKLLVITALLACTDLGRETLFVLLQKEFCSENVVFLAASSALRLKIAAASAAINPPSADAVGTSEQQDTASMCLSEGGTDSVFPKLTQLVLKHLCRGAVMEINTSAANLDALTKASADMTAAAAPNTRGELRVAAAHRLAAALWAIERDVLNMVMRGPVFRFIQRPEFRVWADKFALLLEQHEVDDRPRVQESIAAPTPSTL